MSDTRPRDSETADPDPNSQENGSIDDVKSFARLKRLFEQTRPYRWRLRSALVALFIGAGLGLVYPAYFGKVIQAAFTERDLASLTRFTLILVAVFAAQSVFVFFRHYLMTWLGERVVTDLRVKVYRQLVRMDQQFFHRRRTGELLSRLGDDMTRLQSVVGEDLSMALRNVVTLVGAIGVLVWTSPFLAGVMLLVVPPLVIVSVIWGRAIRKLSRKAQDELARATGGLQEGIAGIETVQAFTREGHEVDRYGEAMESTFGLYRRRALVRSWFMSTASFMAFTAIAGIFWLGGRMVVNGEIGSDQLTSFVLYTMMVAGAVGAIAGLWGRLQSTIGSTARIFEILDEVPVIRDREGAAPMHDIRGDVVFEDVRFAYDDRNVPVVQNIDLKMEPGDVCALVGSSGSGKTTLSRLLLRFYDPQAGRVMVDGRDVRDIPLADLRAAMSVVSQDPILFSGSILENIRYGRLDATDTEVYAAARAANADGFIREFPEGYDTKVGERGIKLSGGQRQRVSIARAILRDPRILILDEATSALDSESEHLVQEALETLQKGRTTMVIAHRLSTIQDADRIVVLEGGSIAEEGSHAELLARGGAYARLVARQTSAAKVAPVTELAAPA